MNVRIGPWASVAVLLACATPGQGSASEPPGGTPARVFQTSFESIDEFRPFWQEPQNHMRSASHAISAERARTGKYAHKGWIYAANATSPFSNTNHRGYPTIQLHKLPGGGFRTPCLVEFWVWLDAAIGRGQWFSFATLSADASDSWRRTVLLNLGSEGWPHLMHVPDQGQKSWSYQNTSVRFPMREWVHLVIYLDLDPRRGFVSAWMNGTLVSESRVVGGHGRLEQAHFGLYAAPSITSGVVYNDDLVIRELVTEDTVPPRARASPLHAEPSSPRSR
jgi:hypothetical protein